MIEGRLGFCCQLALDDEEATKQANMRIFTLSWLARQTPADAHAKVLEIARHNLDALDAQLAYCAALPREERMFRIFSGFLPGWSHPTALPYWRHPEIFGLLETRLAAAGAFARAHDVRLSMHPGQHAVVATLNPAAYANAVVDIMDHVEQFALMGYSGWHPHGCHVNVHGGAGKAGVDGLRQGLRNMPEAGRAMLTLENDEMSFGLDDLLRVGDLVAIVVDFHHHWVHSGGEYLQPGDPRVEELKASWRGVRPAAHISVSPEALYSELLHDEAPDYAQLTSVGFKKGELRAHSQMMWNATVNDMMAAHLAWCDIEVEAKGKNRASRQLADHVRALAA